MEQVLERGERFTGIGLAARYRITNVGEASNANYWLDPGGCVSPAQGGVQGVALLRGGVVGKAGHNGGQGSQGLRQHRNNHHGRAGLRGWVRYGNGWSRGGGSRGGVREWGNSQQNVNIWHGHCGEGAGQSVLRRRIFPLNHLDLTQMGAWDRRPVWSSWTRWFGRSRGCWWERSHYYMIGYASVSNEGGS